MTKQEAPQITVRSLVGDEALGVDLRVAAGAGGLDRLVLHPRVQKSGLALVGHFFGLVPTRVLVLGETELSFVDSLDPGARQRSLRELFKHQLSCLVLTRAGDPDPALTQAADATATPLLVSSARTEQTINALHEYLDERLAPRTTLHGVLADVFGVGLLLLGKSGVGKSECALELVMRGHRLVADDVVECEWRPPGVVFGTAPELLRNHLEVRGLGVLNIHDLFGVTSVTPRKSIDVVVRLVEWDKDEEYERLGVDARTHEILHTHIRELTVPVRPGRDMGTILEIAARNELLAREGRNAAREFLGRLEAELLEQPPPSHSPTPRLRPSRGGERGPGAYSIHESSAHLPAVRPREEGEDE